MISNAQFNTIAELDLEPIKVKLMHKESGEGWSLEHANAMEFEYRRFLYLMKTFPHEQTAPLFDVDIFWHYHILDTMKYAADCDKVFGYFLHHFPYIGLRGEDDEAAHNRLGVRMQQLYEETFGDAYIRENQAQPETAWSAGTKTAWSAATAMKTAWSAGTTMKTAWSAGTTMKTAWSAGTVRAPTDAANGSVAAIGATNGSLSQRLFSERPRLAQAA